VNVSSGKVSSRTGRHPEAGVSPAGRFVARIPGHIPPSRWKAPCASPQVAGHRRTGRAALDVRACQCKIPTMPNVPRNLVRETWAVSARGQTCTDLGTAGLSARHLFRHRLYLWVRAPYSRPQVSFPVGHSSKSRSRAFRPPCPSPKDSSPAPIHQAAVQSLERCWGGENRTAFASTASASACFEDAQERFWTSRRGRGFLPFRPAQVHVRSANGSPEDGV